MLTYSVVIFILFILVVAVFKRKRLLQRIFLITMIAIFSLLVWDALTPLEGDITCNPILVDWQSISWKNISVNSIISSLFSAVVGFLITIIVIEKILDDDRKEDEENRKKQQIRTFLEISEIVFTNYEKAAIALVYDYDEIDKHEKVDVPFSISNFKDVYSPQLYVDEVLMKKKIDLYKESVERVKQFVENLCLNIVVADNVELHTLLKEYLLQESILNSCNQIIAFQNMKSETGATLAKMAIEEVSKLQNSQIGTIQPRQVILYAFVRLYNLVLYHEKFIEKFNKTAIKFGSNISKKRI